MQKMEVREFLNYAFNNRYLFVNLNDDYEESAFGQVIKIYKDDVEILWISNENSTNDNGLKKYKIEDFDREVKPFFLFNIYKTYQTKEHLEIQKKLNNWHLVINHIYESDKRQLKIEDCINFIQQKLNVTKDIAEAFIKINIVRYDKFKFKKTKSGEFITLSKELEEFENKKRYLSSISDEIRSQSNRIDYVIGHGQTVGNYREKLFTSVLSKYIPKKFHIATGFIEGISKQIDIIIYDQHNYIPTFRDDDLVVVKKESVIAVIEIKSTLNAKTLKESLEGIEMITEKGMSSTTFFKGVFAFKSTLSKELISKHISTFYENNQIEAIYEHLDVICIPKFSTQFIDYNNLENEKNSCPSLYEIEDLKELFIGESFFFHKLFSFLDVDITAKKINGKYFYELNSMSKINLIKVLTEDDWMPFFTFPSELNSVKHLDLDTQYDEIVKTNIENAKKHVISIKKWIAGAKSREELIKEYNFDY